MTDGTSCMLFLICSSVCSHLAGDNAVLAGEVGAIDAVVAVMRAHVANDGVLEAACLALRILCSTNGALVSVFLFLHCSLIDFDYI